MENKRVIPKTYLSELRLGEYFYAASQIGKKTIKKFKVVGPSEWISGGRSVRKCIDLSKNKFVNKLSRLSIIRTLP